MVGFEGKNGQEGRKLNFKILTNNFDFAGFMP